MIITFALHWSNEERRYQMIIEISNGKGNTYNHRNYLVAKGLKFNKRSYGKSFYSKRINDEEKEELVEYCKRNRLRYLIIEECHVRDLHYRKEFLQTKNREWTLCAYCGLPVRTKSITVDHIVPVDKVKKSNYAKWVLKLLHIGNVNDIKNLAGACKKCNSSKGTKMGLWILRGFIGKSTAIWIVRWIIRLAIILLCIMAACNMGISYVEAAEMENVSVIEESVMEETVIEEIPVIDSGVTIEVNILQNTAIQNIGGVSDELMQKFSKAYMMVPENVREHFTNDGWTIYATTEDIGQKYYGHKMNILALTVTGEKAIYIDNRKKAANSLIHEMGHYIDYSNDFISSSEEFAEIYNEEVSTFRSIHSTHANNTATAVEYFAEFYMVAILDPEKVKDKCPRTYEFVMRYADVQ